ncbi:MAG: hypothetical protein LBV44_08330 [Methylobacillus sp.]|nr:hypothetical protein [Methylobacillus sp.]
MRLIYFSPKLFLLFLFFAASAHAAPLDPFASWIPAGWKLLIQRTGDLNNDGAADAALVLEKTDPANIKPNKGLGAPELNLNPRRLLVLLNTPGGYKQILSRDDLLPTQDEEENTCLLDPLANGDVSIERGDLIISLQYFMSCGGWGVPTVTYTFRLEGERFRLVHYGDLTLIRNTGTMSQRSFDYLTGQKVTISEEYTSEEQEQNGEPERKEFTEKFTPRKYYLDDFFMSCDYSEDGTPQPDGWCG